MTNLFASLRRTHTRDGEGMVGDEQFEETCIQFMRARFNLPAPMAARLEVQFMHRWDMMIIDLHYTGALLNTFLMNVMEIQNNGTVKRALNRLVQKLSGLLGVDFNEVMNELTSYCTSGGIESVAMHCPSLQSGFFC
jgi:hypothetical protein